MAYGDSNQFWKADCPHCGCPNLHLKEICYDTWNFHHLFRQGCFASFALTCECCHQEGAYPKNKAIYLVLGQHKGEVQAEVVTSTQKKNHFEFLEPKG